MGDSSFGDRSSESLDKKFSKSFDKEFKGKCHGRPDYWPYRRFDGKFNNLKHPEYGSTNVPLLRLTREDYANGKDSLAVRGCKNPNPRVISNSIFEGKFKQHPFLTDMFWAWGQFLDHELDLTEFGDEKDNIETPPNDPVLPNGYIPFSRSFHVNKRGVRQQINQLPAFVDATNVYGFNDERAYALRKLDGSGYLRTSDGPDGPLMPLNTDGLPNAPSKERKDLFLAGDIRSNENPLLTCVHTLFVREHNKICDELVKENPCWKGNDEKIFQEARKIIIGYQQVITYNHFLPILLGPKSRCLFYHGYDARINPGIANEFSAACYRVGHPMVSQSLKSDNGDELDLKDEFFNSKYIRQNGIDGLVGGGCITPMQENKHTLVEAIRSFLFEEPHNGMMMDLASLNIQRGRDHGLPDYNTCRVCLGFPKANDYRDVTSDKELRKKLRKLYDHVGDIDPWVAGLCEDHLPYAQVGQLFHAVLDDQFFRLRHGDRFWWETQSYPGNWKSKIANITLTKIIKRNTNNKHVPRDVFCQDKKCDEWNDKSRDVKSCSDEWFESERRKSNHRSKSRERSKREKSKDSRGAKKHDDKKRRCNKSERHDDKSGSKSRDCKNGSKYYDDRSEHRVGRSKRCDDRSRSKRCDDRSRSKRCDDRSRSKRCDDRSRSKRCDDRSRSKSRSERSKHRISKWEKSCDRWFKDENESDHKKKETTWKEDCDEWFDRWEQSLPKDKSCEEWFKGDKPKSDCKDKKKHVKTKRDKSKNDSKSSHSK